MKGLDFRGTTDSPIFRVIWRRVRETIEQDADRWLSDARAASAEGKVFVCAAATARMDAAVRILNNLEALLEEVRGQKETPDVRSSQEAGLEITEPGFDTV